jgi:tRNA (adenine37-N6)-methyltransferase
MLLNAIGTVHNEVVEPGYIEWREIRSEIRLIEDWRGALVGLDEFSHLMVLFWLHLTDACKVTHVPQGRYRDVPRVGIFACRCQYRPNPIAATIVRMESVSVDDGTIQVVGLDAIDGTAVVDIKPYFPMLDAPEGDIRTPDWVHKLTY